jgi:hypothetical protein
VIKLGVEKRFISALENVPTLVNNSSRKVLAKLAATLAAKKPQMIEHNALPKAYKSIYPPLLHTVDIVAVPPATAEVSLEV